MELIVQLHKLIGGRVFKVEILQVKICLEREHKIVRKLFYGSLFTHQLYNGTFERAPEKARFLNELQVNKCDTAASLRKYLNNI